ncbi:hypothetical protein [Enterocloster citroniae]|nr:hypothetical protein [Enterocloster citroniae]
MDCQPGDILIYEPEKGDDPDV